MCDRNFDSKASLFPASPCFLAFQEFCCLTMQRVEQFGRSVPQAAGRDMIGPACQIPVMSVLGSANSRKPLPLL
jgi:hypothetical protein